MLNLYFCSYIKVTHIGDGGSAMTVSYDKLWKLCKINKIKKSELAQSAELSPYMMSKLSNDKLVSMEVMLRLCKIFHCDIGDLMEVIEND